MIFIAVRMRGFSNAALRRGFGVCIGWMSLARVYHAEWLRQCICPADKKGRSRWRQAYTSRLSIRLQLVWDDAWTSGWNILSLWYSLAGELSISCQCIWVQLSSIRALKTENHRETPVPVKGPICVCKASTSTPQLCYHKLNRGCIGTVY